MYFVFKSKVFLCMAILFLFIALSPYEANAKYCSGGVHLGFGVLMKSEHQCETETRKLDKCYKAKVNNERYWYSGTLCMLSENNAYYKTPKFEYEFKVKGFKIKPQKEKDGVQCFSASSTTGPRSAFHYFCDYDRPNIFDKRSVEKLFRNMAKFSSSPAKAGQVNTQSSSEIQTEEVSKSASIGNFVSFATDSFFTKSSGSLSKAKSLMLKKQTMPVEFLSQLNETFAKEYLENKKKQKAMVGAFPLSCNYRYSSWNYSSLEEAYKRAKNGCEKKINDRNSKLGQNCKCRIVALNNVLFYEPKVYVGEKGEVPIFARILEDGQQIEIKGMVNILDRGSSNSAFTVVTSTGVEACVGHFDIEDQAVGKFSLNCFQGKYVGSGDFVTTGFNTTLRMANGTAEFTATNGAKMFIIFGEDAQ